MKGMRTLRLRVNPDDISEPESDAALTEAAEILRAGGTVAFPTETVYGLGASALDSAAIAKIFEAKQRPSWDPLIVHVCDEAMLTGLVKYVPEAASRLMRSYWPGPLTLLLPRSDAVPDAVTAGRSLVGVRMPRHAVALELIRRAGMPIAAPSANTFGHTSPTTAQHVLDDLDGRIDAVINAAVIDTAMIGAATIEAASDLDHAATDVGVESTVVDPNTSPILIYRPGAVSLEQVRAVAGEAEYFAGLEEAKGLAATAREALPSPGVGIRHYAPRARLILLECGPEEDEATVQRRLLKAADLSGERTGILWPGVISNFQEDLSGAGWRSFYAWGRWHDLDVLARRLFAGLRALDTEGCVVIVAPVPPGEGIGAAIRDRLRKAAF